MKYIKKYESNDEYKIGDYVKLNFFYNGKIFKIVSINDDDYLPYNIIDINEPEPNTIFPNSGKNFIKLEDYEIKAIKYNL